VLVIDLRVFRESLCLLPVAGLMAGLTGMADTSVVDFNAHLTSFGGSDLDVLNGQRRAGFPGDGSLLIVQYCPYRAELTDAR
jgi:hypothetical protein